jgi:hypothetical protein
MGRSGQNFFFHTDDQGNTVALTTFVGTVAERYDYDDYGAVTFLMADGTPKTSSSVDNPYCWHGLRLDAETQLQNDDGGSYFDSQAGCSIARPAGTECDPQTGEEMLSIEGRNGPSSPWCSSQPNSLRRLRVRIMKP